MMHPAKCWLLLAVLLMRCAAQSTQHVLYRDGADSTVLGCHADLTDESNVSLVDTSQFLVRRCKIFCVQFCLSGLAPSRVRLCTVAAGHTLMQVFVTDAAI